MDKDAKRIELENQKAAIEGYLSNPVTVEVLKDLRESQDALVSMLCNNVVRDVESFFAHFEGIGHLRGLRRTESLVKANHEEIKEELRRLDATN